ncbi:ABC transporter permease [Kribbella sp. NPDC026611]|uniref:ABC transporter permease n=1 Tax=Kribbella sp. NPDC026611 TaxID=3154911 RepID=UPI00340C3E58
MDATTEAGSGVQASGRPPWRLALGRLRHDKVAMAAVTILTLYVVMAAVAPILQKTGLIDPYTLHNDLLRPEDGMPAGTLGGVGSHHLFGVEPQTGRDVFARIVAGVTQSMLISVCATVFSITLGTTVGIISGYAGGRVDFVLGRVVDLVLAFPALLMLLTLSVVLIQRISALGVPSGGPAQIVYLILVLGFFGFPFIARVIRGQVLSLREREFMQAARAIGVPTRRIWFKELLPNLWPPLLVFGTLTLPGNVSAEAALSFLGVGVPPPTPTLGNILADSVSFLQADPVFFALPGLAIFVFVLSANLLGDSLRDALDPKS